MHCKYYTLVQRVRRLAARSTNCDVHVNWIPSHLGDECTPRSPECEIEGNAAADTLAKRAALQGRETQYENPDKSLDTWNTYQSIIREAARLVFDVERLFPRAEKVNSRRKGGPAALNPQEVARRRVKPGDDGDGNVT